MKKLSVIALMTAACATVYAGGYKEKISPSMNDSQSHIRVSLAFGPRFINNDVMTNTAWSTAMQLGLGAYKGCQTRSCYYGVEARANNDWDARFNSVNNPANTTTGTLLLHNSASMDFMGFIGRDYGKWSAEMGAGIQISWVKWLNSQQFATDRVRVVPKLRLSLDRRVGQKTKVFMALSQTINPYTSLTCSSGAANCFNDAGYVAVTDLMLGISRTL